MREAEREGRRNIERRPGLFRRTPGAAAFGAIAVAMGVLIALAATYTRKSGVPADAPDPVVEEQPGHATVTGEVPADAIVLLEPAGDREPAPPSGKPVMDQAGLEFVPSLLLVQAGQTVEFRSSEDVLHNVRVTESATHEPVFNIATAPFGSYEHTFERPGFYAVTCDVHPAMRADILVTTAPYVVVAAKDGTFSMPGVPVGSYHVTVYAGARRLERVVQVAAPRTELTLDGE